jgi:hypothetical protein
VTITTAVIENLRKQGANRERREIIGLIRTWKGFYRTSVFKEPPAGQHGRTVDGCSARAIRTVLKEILKDLKDRED